MTIEPVASDSDREACARIMAASDPWITLGVTYERALAALSAADREVYVTKDGSTVAGVAIVSMEGVLSGYLQTIAIAEAFRGRGLGASLLRFVEQRVFREKPNVFLFVSSFNPRARRFYEAHGYEPIGLVRDFLVPGHDECLMRKTIGPVYQFTPASTP